MQKTKSQAFTSLHISSRKVDTFINSDGAVQYVMQQAVGGWPP